MADPTLFFLGVIIYLALFRYLGKLTTTIAVVGGIATALYSHLILGVSLGSMVSWADPPTILTTVSMLMTGAVVSGMGARAVCADVLNRIHSPKAANAAFYVIAFVFAMFLHNIVATLLLTDLALVEAVSQQRRAMPVLATLTTAINAGGASFAVGDFPNIIISIRGHLDPALFTLFMMGPCLMLMALTVLWFRHFDPNSYDGLLRGIAGRRKVHESKDVRTSRKVVVLFIGLSAATLIGLGRIGLSIEWISLILLLNALALYCYKLRASKAAILKNIEDTLRGTEFYVLAIYGSLFLLAGAMAYSGIPQILFGLIGDDPLNVALATFGVAALLTTLMGAGETTALLAPLLAATKIGLQPPVTGLIWWSLSLGVFVGSSTNPVAATGGRLMFEIVKRWLGEKQTSFSAQVLRKHVKQETFSASAYTRTMLPSVLLMCGASLAYLVVLVRVGMLAAIGSWIIGLAILTLLLVPHRERNRLTQAAQEIESILQGSS